MIVTFEKFEKQFEQTGEHILIQTVIGRSGSIFLQSLLDSHPEILMFPGVINFFTDIFPYHQKNPEKWSENISNVIRSWMETLEPYNIYQKLGKERNETIDVDLDQIINIMKTECNIKESPSAKKLFLALHYAIGTYYSIDLSRIKYIYVHEHTLDFNKFNLQNSLSLFPNTHILCIIRDPRANHISINNWMNKTIQTKSGTWKVNKFENRYSDFCWKWYKNGLSTISKQSKYYTIIRLEDIHTHREYFLKTLCNRLSIHYSNTILHSTFLGKNWSGDEFSPQIEGFRKSNTFNQWQPYLNIYWKLFYEATLKNELSQLGYDIFYSKYYITKALLIIGFPFWFVKDLEYLKDKKFYTYKNNKLNPQIYTFIDGLYKYLKNRILLFKVWIIGNQLNLKDVILKPN